MNAAWGGVIVMLVLGWVISLILIAQNDNLTEVEETKRMTACVQSGGEWLENEGMSAKMECVKR